MAFQLEGRSILTVEDEILIALDLEDAGARVARASSLHEASRQMDTEQWSAAILDFVLGNSDGSSICKLFTERSIPFVLYTGHPRIEGVCTNAIHVSKPADADMLIT